jgi:hypothetical protein
VSQGQQYLGHKLSSTWTNNSCAVLIWAYTLIRTELATLAYCSLGAWVKKQTFQ